MEPRDQFRHAGVPDLEKVRQPQQSRNKKKKKKHMRDKSMHRLDQVVGHTATLVDDK